MSSFGALSNEEIDAAMQVFGLSPLPPGATARFSDYFDLLQQWNAKLNLTAIREPQEILRRHFLECIFCAQNLPAGIGTLLDYGSGAGFPGIPIALCRPEIRVTLAESQGKKASFLREAVRRLEIHATVFAGRVEEMASGEMFDVVTLRAVDKMQTAIDRAALRVKTSGWLVLLAGEASFSLPGHFVAEKLSLPNLESAVMVVARHGNVPRETSG